MGGSRKRTASTLNNDRRSGDSSANQSDQKKKNGHPGRESSRGRRGNPAARKDNKKTGGERKCRGAPDGRESGREIRDQDKEGKKRFSRGGSRAFVAQVKKAKTLGLWRITGSRECKFEAGRELGCKKKNMRPKERNESERGTNQANDNGVGFAKEVTRIVTKKRIKTHGKKRTSTKIRKIAPLRGQTVPRRHRENQKEKHQQGKRERWRNKGQSPVRKKR